MPPTTCKELIKDYCANCTFAGIHYIADETKHWFERAMLGLRRCCSASGMFADARTACFHATMRVRAASLLCRVRASSNTVLRVIADRLDCPYMRHCISRHVTGVGWLWVGLVILSWYGSAVLIIAAFEAFLDSPISFGVETTYTKWDTELPSVAVCETANDDKLFSVCDTIWPPDHLLDLEDALKDIVYFRGISFTLIEVCAIENPDPMCLMTNYSYYASLVRSGCKDLLTKCSYNDVPFDCCEYFQPIDTDMGTCFIINSIQTKKTKPFPMVSNMRSKRSSIKFDVLLHGTMYTLGRDEVPSITTLQSSTLKIQLGHIYRRQVAVRDIENDPLIVETSPEQRACRFNSENQGGLYPQYSYSACTVLCRKKAQMDKCKCNDHFMLNTPESDHCNITGMACIHAHASHLTTLKPPWANRPGLTCDCLPSCDETEITIIKDVDTSLRSKKHQPAQVEMVLAYLPTERFKRNVVRSRLDLVVSVGGTTGLFVGASLLSFVELIVYFTIRFVINIWLERRAQRSNVVILNEDVGDRDSVYGTEEILQHETPYPNSGVLQSQIEYDKLYSQLNPY